jgi:hypothetical protein
MSRYAKLIAEARNPETQEAGNPEVEKTRKPASKKKRTLVKQLDDKDVNLSIKVLESRRRHWAAEAKRRGVTLTEVICEALSKKFGEPSAKG